MMKLKTPQRKTRREKKHSRRKIIIVTSLMAILIAGFFYIMNRDFVAYTSVRSEGQKILMEQEIVSFAEEYLSGRYVGIIRRDNFLLFNKKVFGKRLEKHFPRLQDVRIYRQGNTLMISSGERSAHSLWCVNKEYLHPFNEECYYVDVSGVMYARSPYFSGNTYFKVFFDKALIPGDTPLHQSVYTGQDFLDFFIFLENLEEQFDMNIHSVVIDEMKDVSVLLARIKNIRYDHLHPSIMFQGTDSYELVFRNIKITLGTDVFKKDFVLHPRLLKSIDVRFPGRAFYIFSDTLQEYEIPTENEIE